MISHYINNCSNFNLEPYQFISACELFLTNNKQVIISESVKYMLWVFRAFIQQTGFVTSIYIHFPIFWISKMSLSGLDKLILALIRYIWAHWISSNLIKLKFLILAISQTIGSSIYGAIVFESNEYDGGTFILGALFKLSIIPLPIELLTYYI